MARPKEQITELLSDEKGARRLVCVPGKVETNVFVEGSLSMLCSHKVSGRWRKTGSIMTYEIVQTVNVFAAKQDKVLLLYGGHKLLSGPGLLKKEGLHLGQKVYEIPCGYPEDIKLKEKRFFLPAHWKELTRDPKTYLITGAAHNIEIKAYPPHQCQLSISFPSIKAKSFSGGTKLVGEKVGEKEAKSYVFKPEAKKTKKTDTTWNPWNGTFTRVEHSTGDGSPGESLEITSGTASVKEITYKVDGLTVQIQVLEILQGILNLGKTIMGIIEQVQDNVPKVGWYFDMGFELLQGSANFAWGWKEYKDHRAYFGMGAHLALKVITLHAELGIGVEGFQFQLQVFGRLEGEAELKVGLQRNSPDQMPELEVPFGASIKGLLGFRAKVSILASVEGVVESAIELKDATFTYHFKTGFSIQTKVVWTGLKARIKGSVGPQTNYVSAYKGGEAERVLIKGKVWKEWKWPSQEKFKPEELTPAELRAILKERFTDGIDVRVATKMKLDLILFDHVWENEMTMDHIVEGVAHVIGKRTDIYMTKKAMEALAFEVRAKLESYEEKISATLLWRIDRKHFDSFCAGKLDVMLNKYIDPLKVQYNKLAQGT